MSLVNAFYKKTGGKYTYYDVYVRCSGFLEEIGSVNHGCKGTEFVGCRFFGKTSSLNYASAVVDFFNNMSSDIDFDFLHDGWNHRQGHRRGIWQTNLKNPEPVFIFTAPTRY